MTKRETRRAKLLELWDDDEDVLLALKEEMPKEVLEQYDYDEAVNQAEALLVYLGSREDFYTKECVGCGRDFLSSYTRVTTCSVRCLKRALEAYGFAFDPSKSPEERWRPKKWLPDPVRGPKEPLKRFEERQKNHLADLQFHHPVPLLVPAEAVQVLRELDQDENPKTLPEQEENVS